MTTSRKLIVGAVVCSVVGLAVPVFSGPAVAEEDLLTAATSVTATAIGAGDEASYSYVGSKKCKKCHFQQHKSWKKTKMGQAFETLKPGKAKEAKEKFNLDVDKDYTKDPTCLKCHTVGFGKEGGYTIPDLEDKRAVRKSKSFQGVGCESCHGPGSAYIEVFEDILKSKRNYKVEELYAVGLQKIDEDTCLACHNQESPTIEEGYTFNYEEKKDEGTHEHVELKQREE